MTKTNKSQKTWNVISILLAALLLAVLVFTLVFPLYSVGQDKKCSIAKYVFSKGAQTTAMTEYLVDQSESVFDDKLAALSDECTYCTMATRLAVPFFAMMAVTVAAIIVSLVRARLGSILVFAAGAVGVWACLSDAPLMLAGIPVIIILVLSLLMMLIGLVRVTASGCKCDKKNVCLNLLCAALALGMLILVFPLNIENGAVTMKVRGIGTTAATNPYLVTPLQKDLGTLIVISPMLMLALTVVTLLVSVLMNKSGWVRFLQLATAAVSVYTLASNRLFWGSNAVMLGGMFCAVMLLAVSLYRFAEFAADNGIRVTTVNTVALILVAASIVMLFLPLWVMKKQPENSKEKDVTVSVFGITQPLEVKRFTYYPVAAELLANDKDKDAKAIQNDTVSDMIKDTNKLKKLLSVLEKYTEKDNNEKTGIIYRETLTYRVEKEIRNEKNTIAVGSLHNAAPSGIVVDMRSYTVYPIAMLVAGALLMLLCVLKRDSAEIGFLTGVYAVFGFIVFAVNDVFHFSTLYLWYLAVFALLLLFSAVNVCKWINTSIAERREFSKYGE